jgi:FKBP-type peptidyl-prolyl cis-trans isomerase FkpA
MKSCCSLIVLVTFALVAAACKNDTTAPSANVPYSQTDLRVGTGAEAVNNRTVTVNYTGWLYSATAPDNKGTQFDTSIGRTPFSFVLGTGNVIAGWHRGVAGMRVGGLRRLVIPPELAYGSQGAGTSIPPNATLVFDIELLNVQ